MRIRDEGLLQKQVGKKVIFYNGSGEKNVTGILIGFQRCEHNFLKNGKLVCSSSLKECNGQVMLRQINGKEIVECTTYGSKRTWSIEEDVTEYIAKMQDYIKATKQNPKDQEA